MEWRWSYFAVARTLFMIREWIVGILDGQKVDGRGINFRRYR